MARRWCGVEVACLAAILCAIPAICNSQGGPDPGRYYTVLEEEPRGTHVADLLPSTTDDVDSDAPQMDTYTIQPSDDDLVELFAIEDSYRLVTAQVIDREAVCYKQSQCVISLFVVARSAPQHLIPVYITVNDTNDHEPVFPSADVTYLLSEAHEPGRLRDLPIALDRDYGVYDVTSYIISNSSIFDIQTLRSADGTPKLQLNLVGELDRETNDHFTLLITASDGGVPALSGVMVLNITLTDVNDNAPVFSASAYEKTVLESLVINATVIVVQATDRDIGVNSQISYAFLPNTQQSYGDSFYIVENTGEIKLKRRLNYGDRHLYQLGVVAVDSGAQPLSGETTVYIEVEDINNHAPRIVISSTNGNGAEMFVPENSDRRSFVAHVTVSDADSGEGGQVVCNLGESSEFVIEMYQQLGEQYVYSIYTQVGFDREAEERYTITITCKDRGQPMLTENTNIDVVIVDVNDNAPRFRNGGFAVHVQENNMVGEVILPGSSIAATDRDTGSNGNVTYRVTSGGDWFDVDPISGEITANSILDHEITTLIDLRIVATDHGVPPLSDELLVEVIVDDINDESPVFDSDSYLFRVTEEQQQWSFIGRVDASDADSDPYNIVRYRFSPDDANKPFSINDTTGSIYAASQINREIYADYTLTVIAHNPGYIDLQSHVRVHVDILDINDNRPHIDYPNNENTTIFISNNLDLGSKVYQAVARDLDAGNNARLTYALITTTNEYGVPFAINSTSGMIYTVADISDITSGNVTLTIVVRDHGDPPLDARSTLNIMIRVAHDGEAVVGSETSSNKNKAIVISITVASIVVIIILVTAIAFLKFCTKQKLYSNHKPVSTDAVNHTNLYASSNQTGRPNAPLYGIINKNVGTSEISTDSNYVYSDYSLTTSGTAHTKPAQGRQAFPRVSPARSSPAYGWEDNAYNGDSYLVPSGDTTTSVTTVALPSLPPPIPSRQPPRPAHSEEPRLLDPRLLTAQQLQQQPTYSYATTQPYSRRVAPPSSESITRRLVPEGEVPLWYMGYSRPQGGALLPRSLSARAPPPPPHPHPPSSTALPPAPYGDDNNKRRRSTLPLTHSHSFNDFTATAAGYRRQPTDPTDPTDLTDPTDPTTAPPTGLPARRRPSVDFRPGSYHEIGVYLAMQPSHAYPSSGILPDYVIRRISKHPHDKRDGGYHQQHTNDISKGVELRSFCSEEDECSHTDSGRGVSDADSYTYTSSSPPVQPATLQNTTATGNVSTSQHAPQHASQQQVTPCTSFRCDEASLIRTSTPDNPQHTLPLKKKFLGPVRQSTPINCNNNTNVQLLDSLGNLSVTSSPEDDTSSTSGSYIITPEGLTLDLLCVTSDTEV